MDFSVIANNAEPPFVLTSGDSGAEGASFGLGVEIADKASVWIGFHEF
jgi:hypothetical protein